MRPPHPQGVGAARPQPRGVALRRGGLPKAVLALHRSFAQAGALGHREQEQRVQEHAVPAARGEVRPRLPAAEGQIQGDGQGKYAHLEPVFYTVDLRDYEVLSWLNVTMCRSL